jgi:hypothetical protein
MDDDNFFSLKNSDDECCCKKRIIKKKGVQTKLWLLSVVRNSLFCRLAFTLRLYLPDGLFKVAQ